MADADRGTLVVLALTGLGFCGFIAGIPLCGLALALAVPLAIPFRRKNGDPHSEQWSWGRAYLTAVMICGFGIGGLIALGVFGGPVDHYRVPR